MHLGRVTLCISKQLAESAGIDGLLSHVYPGTDKTAVDEYGYDLLFLEEYRRTTAGVHSSVGISQRSAC